jgi:hypothetical protein
MGWSAMSSSGEVEQILPKVKAEFLRLHARSEEEEVELNHARSSDVPDRGERSVQVEEK